MADIVEWRTSIEAIRHQISVALEQPDSRVAITERARSVNPAWSDVLLSQMLDHLELFVRGTPDLLELLASEAETQGVLAALEPVLTIASTYFSNEHDMVPDHLGLYGLVDDGYVVQRYLLSVSAAHEAKFGTALLGEGLRPAIATIRYLIGEETADLLDNKAETDVQQLQWPAPVVSTGPLKARALRLIQRALDHNGDPTSGPEPWGDEFEEELKRSVRGSIPM